MGPVRSIAAAVLLVTACPAGAETVADWRGFMREASLRFGVPSDWIERVMRAESGGQTTLAGLPIVSRKGAMGLMQLMPDTWNELRLALQLGRNPFDPHDNILAGTAYLRLMYDRFGYPGLFAAYNAGPGRYGAYVAGRAPLPGETTAYLAAVTGMAPGAAVRRRSWLFAPRIPPIPTVPAASPPRSSIGAGTAPPEVHPALAGAPDPSPDPLFAIVKSR